MLSILFTVQSYGQTSRIPVVVTNTMRGTDIYLYDVLSGTFEVIVSDSYRNEEPYLSPDGSKMVYSSNRSGAIDLYLIDMNTLSMSQITDNNAFETSPAWDWTSERIVFTSQDQGDARLVVYHVLTGISLNIAEGYDFFDPQWSPDGQKIIFTSQQNQDELSRLYLLDLATEMVIPIAPPEVTAVSPKWSPDGSMIGFWSHEQIYVWSATTELVTQVTHEVEVIGFAWLQSNTILYRTFEGGSSGTVYQILPDGTNKQIVSLQLPYFPNIEGIELPNLLILPTLISTPTPSHTPTPVPTPFGGGGAIVFECGDICIADGYNTFVTYGTQPRIGPGNRIALAQAFPSAIVLFDTDDGSSVTVASGTGTFSEPALSPDGTKVLYAFKPAGTNQK
ncbi:MAG: PD40 domain-containing protein, partial [Anaerolineae bacterium]|nr:PD40 domain-containing protein [Anaerolineae bacterium]